MSDGLTLRMVEVSRMPSGHKTNGELDFGKVLNGSLNVFFKDALRVALTHPRQAAFFMQTLRWQRKAAKTRLNWDKKGVHVPPIIVLSVTSECNLHCEGCYHQALRSASESEMSDERLGGLIAEARELGVSFMVIGGGEPLTRPIILDLAQKYPAIMFLVFTNGLLIDEAVINKMSESRNIVPLISLEGYENDTDKRRGAGVYAQVLNAIAKLKEKNIFWGSSLTMTRANFADATDENFVKRLVEAGCKLFMFVEYTPVKKGTEDWVLTSEQRTELLKKRDLFRKKFSAMFIALPWDEEEIGGCLSSGRGFIHISAEGNVEPCPFVPYSDTNLKHLSLKDALQSKMLKTIRENHGQLEETHGCALWEKREWVKSLTKKAGDNVSGRQNS
ncbi:MAG: radical SAM protein [Candidatus Bathyarchaeia archaeon]